MTSLISNLSFAVPYRNVIVECVKVDIRPLSWMD